jgi:hypothetical protein
VAELVDARDLKFPASTENAAIFCKTAVIAPAVSAAHPRILQNISEAHFVAFASEEMARDQAREPSPTCDNRPHDYDKTEFTRGA